MIKLSTPFIDGNEHKYVKDCLDTGWISSAGKYVDKFEDSIKNYTKSKYAIACMNGTVGLQLSLRVLNVKANDIVLTTNLTFVATLNAISYVKATPYLFDVNPNTWQIDLDLLREWLISSCELIASGSDTICIEKSTGRKISAIIPVHVMGNLVDVKALKKISEDFFIPIIEDSTEALGSFFNDKHAGTFGDIGVFSFNGNKIISTGGGGMIVTDNEELAIKAKHLSTTAKKNNLFYFHDEIGYNYRLVNVLAAIGLAQMEMFQFILEKKKNIFEIYSKELSALNQITLQESLENSRSNCWLFSFRSPQSKSLMNYLKNHEIESRPLWTPMNKLPMYRSLKYINISDNCNKIFEESISIPSSAHLTSEEQKYVINVIKKFFK